MSGFAKSIGISLIAFLLTAHRLFAPIVEEEKSTPAVEQSEAHKRRQVARSTETEHASAQTETRPAAPPAAQGPARFAGTWSGKVNQGLLGHVPTTVTIDSAATSVELNRNLGGGNRRTTINGNTLSWHSGLAGEITWTLTPNSDGQTAQVTMKGMLLNDTMTFRRGQSGLTSPAQSR